jgi:hypothetical protein
MKQFSTGSIHKMDDKKKPYWFFDCGMISTCKPVFDKCESNHDVEKVLRKAGVIRKNNMTDTESSALVVLFSSAKSGEAFIQRLNVYLAKTVAQLDALTQMRRTGQCEC